MSYAEKIIAPVLFVLALLGSMWSPDTHAAETVNGYTMTSCTGSTVFSSPEAAAEECKSIMVADWKSRGYPNCNYTMTYNHTNWWVRFSGTQCGSNVLTVYWNVVASCP